MNPRQWLLLLLHVTHYLCVAVWVGVMLFNLIVNFPAMRARSASSDDLLRNVTSQAHRAGPWLYLLIAGAVASGLGLLLLAPPGTRYMQVMAIKGLLVALMLAVHLYATLRILPQLHFAREQERGPLLLGYQATIFASSVFGILAILFGYAPRVA
jgi:hypothetical protein